MFEAAAHALQTEPLWYEVDSVSGFEERFKQMTTQQVHAVIILGSPFTFQHMRLITELAGKHRMPATYEAKDFVQAGGLMSYGVDFEDLSRAARSSWTGFSAGRSPHCCRSNSQRNLSSL